MVKSRSGSASIIIALLIVVTVVPSGMAAEFGRLAKAAGDRQIVVGPFNAPKAPFTVQVLDVAGVPTEGVGVFITATQPHPNACAPNVDEFGFYGFNAFSQQYGCGIGPLTYATSDAEGRVTLSPNDMNSSPSAFLIGASASIGMQEGVPDITRYNYFTVIRAVSAPAGEPVVVVEYFHDGYRNYFNTIDQAEIDGLDAGVFSGWTREVGGFIAWPSQTAAMPGAVPVCRFFASVFTSHFYTADPVECDAVVANYPEWQLETREAYWIVLPDKATGACGEGLMPVYRVFKPWRPNHRYVTDRAVRDTMVAAGWIAEGYGPDAVIMCTPR